MTTSLVTTTPIRTTSSRIELRGVRVHNLKGIDLDIPLGQLVVLSGVSGSGKSSLAFDTLFAEGQRRYIESFSASARQYLERIERPNADRIAHVPPAIGIRSATGRQRFLANTTVAGLAEIEESLRRLFARIGRVICPSKGCRAEVRSHSVEDVVRAVKGLPDGSRFLLCFPLIGAEHEGWAEPWLARGFTRVILHDKLRLLTDFTSQPCDEDVWVVVDRLVAGRATEERVAEAAETAFHEQFAACVLMEQRDDPTSLDNWTIDGQRWRLTRFVRAWRCPLCTREYLPPQPQLFNPDSGGSCEACRGAKADELTVVDCATCFGSRLRREALAVRVGDDNLSELLRLPVSKVLTKIIELEGRLNPEELGQSRLLRDELIFRLSGVRDLGLGHLTLLRSAATLSGGEARRLMLAAAIGSRLTGTLCVVDEPSAGLHPDEMPLVIAALRQLQQLQNSVVVVDHASEIVRAADHVIDLGPGAGPAGGSIVYAGPPSELSLVDASATGLALRRGATGEGLRSPVSAESTGGSKQPPVPPCERAASVSLSVAKRTPPDWLTLTNVRHRHLGGMNLIGQTLRVPLGVLCVVSGRSGRGKTSLIVETLFPAVCARLGQPSPVTIAGAGDVLTGGDSLVEAVLVDQSPLTRSPRSNAATWIGVFDDIRDIFALMGEAKQRGFGPQHFSFNATAGGRCRACRGTGVLRHDMQFLPDVSLTCPECHGTRYRHEILEVKYRSRTIADVLAMSAVEAAAFFRNHPKLRGRLQMLKQIGLDYLVLGQPTDTLSGGEAQRLKLASHLTASRGPTLIVCDEPTAGLHPADVSRLIACFHELLAIGHSLVVIDNNPLVRRAADHLMEL